jgi:presenilin-like A22 family membrane protease
MKHNLSVTALLVLFFLLAQIVGLALINYKFEIVKVGNETNIGYTDISGSEIPEWQTGIVLLYVLGGVLIGTLLVLLIIKLKRVKLWKAWFFIAVLIAITFSLDVLIKNTTISVIIALILTYFKVYKPNIVIHNLTEILMYAGIGLFIVGLFKTHILGAIILLLIISLYDIYAVFKSKHMVKMAKFQAKSQVFAGLMIPYTPKAEASSTKASAKAKSDKFLKISEVDGEKAFKEYKAEPEKKNAILGGGDIAFPLIFTGVVMQNIANKLYINMGLTLAAAKSIAFQQSLVITLTTTIAIALLFVFAKKDKFYPAMPIVTAGCLIGYGIVALL